MWDWNNISSEQLFMGSARLQDDVGVRWAGVNPHLAPPLDGCSHDCNEGAVNKCHRDTRELIRAYVFSPL